MPLKSLFVDSEGSVCVVPLEFALMMFLEEKLTMSLLARGSVPQGSDFIRFN